MFDRLKSLSSLFDKTLKLNEILEDVTPLVEELESSFSDLGRDLELLYGDCKDVGNIIKKALDIIERHRPEKT